ncbi:MAG: hypothetical protein JW384_03576 [Nitrosomonadaceae bacterium]|nr:hypothetical protein [Nitrosomonadaceae bacterium]
MRVFNAAADIFIFTNCFDIIFRKIVAHTDTTPTMNGHTTHMRGCNARRGRDGWLDAVFAKVPNVAIDCIRLARPRLAGKKDMCPRFKHA